MTNTNTNFLINLILELIAIVLLLLIYKHVLELLIYIAQLLSIKAYSRIVIPPHSVLHDILYQSANFLAPQATQ